MSCIYPTPEGYRSDVQPDVPPQPCPRADCPQSQQSVNQGTYGDYPQARSADEAVAYRNEKAYLNGQPSVAERFRDAARMLGRAADDLRQRAIGAHQLADIYSVIAPPPEAALILTQLTDVLRSYGTIPF